jgi:antibiotic biosynthesis monooxygenase (ABM) superfamily enzyme
MVVTVFRARVRPESNGEYTQWAERMAALACTMPGYVSHKGFAAADGERVTIVEFENMDALRAWSAHPEHVDAKKKDVTAFTASIACKSAGSSMTPASRATERMARLARWLDAAFARAQHSAWRRATYY